MATHTALFYPLAGPAEVMAVGSASCAKAVGALRVPISGRGARMLLAMLAPALGAPAGYAALVWLMRRAPSGSLAPLLHARRLHDVVLAIYSALVASVMLTKLVDYGRLGSLHALVCESSPGAPLYWHASKFLEWADTALLFAASRPPSRLHLFHHASTPSLVWLNLVGRANPTPVFDVATGLNAWCHLWQVAVNSL
jgi:hypothetical protein